MYLSIHIDYCITVSALCHSIQSSNCTLKFLPMTAQRTAENGCEKLEPIKIQPETLLICGQKVSARRSLLFEPNRRVFLMDFLTSDNQPYMVGLYLKNFKGLKICTATANMHIVVLEMDEKKIGQLSAFYDELQPTTHRCAIVFSFAMSDSKIGAFVQACSIRLQLRVERILFSECMELLGPLSLLFFYQKPQYTDAFPEVKDDPLPSTANVGSEQKIIELEDPSVVRVKFSDGSEFKISLDTLQRCVRPNSWLNDTMVDFYVDYLMKNVLTETDRQSVHIFDSMFFSRLYRHREMLRHNIGYSAEDLDILSQHLNKLYPLRRGKRSLPVFDKDLLVVPVFWENHWMLLLIHGLRQAVFDIEELLRDINISSVDSSPPPPPSTCRLIIMDSKMHDKPNAEILPRIHKCVFEMMTTWCKIMIYNQMFDVPRQRFSYHRCQNLPDQPNSFDCGFYMLKFAEHFVCNSRDWLELPDASIPELSIGSTQEEYEQKIGTFRGELIQLIRHLSGRNISVSKT